MGKKDKSKGSQFGFFGNSKHSSLSSSKKFEQQLSGPNGTQSLGEFNPNPLIDINSPSESNAQKVNAGNRQEVVRPTSLSDSEYTPTKKLERKTGPATQLNLDWDDSSYLSKSAAVYSNQVQDYIFPRGSDLKKIDNAIKRVHAVDEILDPVIYSFRIMFTNFSDRKVLQYKHIDSDESRFFYLITACTEKFIQSYQFSDDGLVESTKKFLKKFTSEIFRPYYQEIVDYSQSLKKEEAQEVEVKKEEAQEVEVKKEEAQEVEVKLPTNEFQVKMIMREMLTTERTFNKEMRYFNTLLACLDKLDPENRGHYQFIQSGLNEIVDESTKFLKTLEIYGKEDFQDYDKALHVILNWDDLDSYFDALKQHILHQIEKQNSISQLFFVKGHFQSKIEMAVAELYEIIDISPNDARDLNEIPQTHLDSLNILPIQRGPRIQLLVKELTKHTESGELRLHLDSVMQLCIEKLNKINSSIASYEKISPKNKELKLLETRLLTFIDTAELVMSARSYSLR